MPPEDGRRGLNGGDITQDVGVKHEPLEGVHRSGDAQFLFRGTLDVVEDRSWGSAPRQAPEVCDRPNATPAACAGWPECRSREANDLGEARWPPLDSRHYIDVS
jgi:hypothetical protein